MTALLALALAAAPGCPAALASAAATPDGALAARAAGLVRELEEAGAGGPSAALAAAAEALGAPADGGDREAASFRGALARHCALAAAPRLPEASTGDRGALAEVLARPELSQARLDPWAIRRGLLRLWDWLVEQLGTQEAERYASLGRALFLGAAAAAVALGVSALRRRRRGGRAALAAQAEVGSAERAGGAAGVDASAARAEEALRRGEAREAVRFALLAALGALERAGRVPRGRALTNGEIVRVASSSGGQLVQVQEGIEVAADSSSPSSDLALLAHAFDRAVYGGRTVTPEEARVAIAQARRVAAALGGTP